MCSFFVAFYIHSSYFTTFFIFSNPFFHCCMQMQIKLSVFYFSYNPFTRFVFLLDSYNTRSLMHMPTTIYDNVNDDVFFGVPFFLECRKTVLFSKWPKNLFRNLSSILIFNLLPTVGATAAHNLINCGKRGSKRGSLLFVRNYNSICKS